MEFCTETELIMFTSSLVCGKSVVMESGSECFFCPANKGWPFLLPFLSQSVLQIFRGHTSLADIFSTLLRKSRGNHRALSALLSSRKSKAMVVSCSQSISCFAFLFSYRFPLFLALFYFPVDLEFWGKEKRKAQKVGHLKVGKNSHLMPWKVTASADSLKLDRLMGESE